MPFSPQPHSTPRSLSRTHTVSSSSSPPSSQLSPRSIPTSPLQGDPQQSSSTSAAMDLSSLLPSLPSLNPPSSSGTDSGAPHPHNGVLTVPLEVLERILRYTFLRLTKFTPSSDPYPHRNTSHLLLVSKAFRELCLPFFFYSVTIARPSDFITFFDPEKGIFVAGEEGKQRWSLVQLLGFGFNVEPRSRFPMEDQSSWIVPLVAPDPGQLRTVCFFNEEVCSPVQTQQELYAVGEALQEEETRSRALESIKSEYEHSISLSNDSLELEEWAASVFNSSLEDEIEYRIVQESTDAILISRSDFYGHLVSPDPTRTIPIVFRLSDHIVHLSLLTAIIHQMQEHLLSTLFIYRNPTSSPSPDSPDAPFVTHYFSMIRRLLEIYMIELFGYSTTHRPFFLDQFYEPDEDEPYTYRYAMGSTQADGGLMLLPDVLYEHNLVWGRCLPLSEAFELELRGKPAVVVQPETEESV